MADVLASDIFQRGVAEGCSDIHVKPGSPPKMRKNGRLVVIPGYESLILDSSLTESLLHQTMDPQAFSKYQQVGINQLDYSYELPAIGRFRMNAYKTRAADAFVGRLLQHKARSLVDLGVPSSVKKLADSKAGLIIVSGATGSGKSTTMAGIIDYINNTKPVNIISIEDPIEIVHSDAMASIAQREVGVDVDSFEAALNAALREDPDVILIGEIRTEETLKTALLAADTGHLVIATLHTTDASKTINRIIALYPEKERDLARQSLAAVLRGVVAQRLVPNIAGTRTVVNEVLINTPEVADAILNVEGETVIKEIITRSPSMLTFEQCFIEKVESAVIDLKTAKEYSTYPEYFDTIEINLPASHEGQAGVEAKKLPPLPFGNKNTNLPQPKAQPRQQLGSPLSAPRNPLAPPTVHKRRNPLD